MRHPVTDSGCAPTNLIADAQLDSAPRLIQVGRRMRAAVPVDETGLHGDSMKPLRIVVVEVDATIGALLAEMLDELGHIVCGVEVDAENAVAAAARWRPELMIVDVGLGEASSVAAVKEILRGGFVPYVFVTGDFLRDLGLGPDAVLIQKPFRGPDLISAIQRAVSGAPLRDETVLI